MITEAKKSEIKLTSLNEARKLAKSTNIPQEKFQPIRLKSLREARDLVKSLTVRPDSVLSLPDKLMAFNLFDEELNSRNVYSVSPKQNLESSDSDNFGEKEIINPEITETNLIRNLGNIEVIQESEQDIIKENDILEDEKKNNEANDRIIKVEKEESSLNNKEIGLEHEEKNFEEKSPEENKNDTEEYKIEVEKSISPTFGHKKNKNNKLINNFSNKVIKTKLPKGKNPKTRKPKANVLKFIDEKIVKKKLSKSQERTLLDRLQGFQFKPSK